MITKPTALVLGAGASIPYGFPSAKDLRNVVLDNTYPRPSKNWINLFSDLDATTEEDLRDFGGALQESGMASVDAFLEYRTDLIPLGKLTIAAALIPCENENNLYTFSRKGGESWYEFLWGKLRAPYELLHENRLSIITFNYDRSLEQYIFKCIKRTFNLKDNECYEKLKAIPIVHVHGTLGTLPWQVKRTTQRPYTAEIPWNYVKIAGDQIKIISDKEQNEEDIQLARQLLIDAEMVYFLGFGYHEANMDRLDIGGLNKNKLFGTGRGLGIRKYADVRKKWGVNINRSRPDITSFLEDIVVFD